MNSRALFLALALVVPAISAHADGEINKLITAADKGRLARYDDTRKEALAEARKDGAAADIATLNGVIEKPVVSFSGFDMTGKWQCRTIKTGGPAPLVVYGWFKCKVTDDGSGWTLQKTTGSQRTKGRFFDDGDKRLIYLGSFHVDGDPIKPYGAGPDSDQVGYAFRTGKNKWRIELPAPRYESKLDIIEFKR